MGERLSGGNVALALLANTIATGTALVALILAFGPISGAHLNPGVTLADATQGGLPWREVPAYTADCSPSEIKTSTVASTTLGVTGGPLTVAAGQTTTAAIASFVGCQ